MESPPLPPRYRRRLEPVTVEEFDSLGRAVDLCHKELLRSHKVADFDTFLHAFFRLPFYGAQAYEYRFMNHFRPAALALWRKRFGQEWD
jgi:hypothetical protein